MSNTLKELMAEVSPRPWSIHGGERIVAPGYLEYVRRHHYLAGPFMVANLNNDHPTLNPGMPAAESRANGILINHCVNTYEELVDALVGMLTAHQDEDDATWCRATHQYARQTLAKANHIQLTSKHE